MGLTRNQPYSVFSKKRVNRAGNNFRDQKEDEEDARVLEKWRALHRQVLDTFQRLLRNRAKHSDGKIVIAQRHKRKSAIIDKLRKLSGMNLSQMNDIAGCRLIFENTEALYEFRKNFHNSRLRHDLKDNPDKYDYIKSPKDNGYRGVHDVYSYNGTQHKGLLIEIQYRTLVQHSWATAVEVMGFVTGNDLKSGQGDKKLLEIFCLASEILARTFEDKKSFLGHLSDNEVVEMFDRLNSKIDFAKKLKLLDVIQERVSERKNTILMFEDETKLRMWDFPTVPKALEELVKLEREKPDKNIVLVRADKGKDMRIAFKNYFSDANDFIDKVFQGRSILSSKLTEPDLGAWVKLPPMEPIEISLQKAVEHAASGGSFIWTDLDGSELRKHLET